MPQPPNSPDPASSVFVHVHQVGTAEPLAGLPVGARIVSATWDLRPVPPTRPRG